jgi:hypothetical protein
MPASDDLSSAFPNMTKAWLNPEERLFKSLLESIFDNSDEDAQFSGDIASMEALSVGNFKARSKEIQANAMKGMAIANALSSININVCYIVLCF